MSDKREPVYSIPETLYGYKKSVADPDDSYDYLSVDEDVKELAHVGKTMRVGVYKLVEVLVVSNEVKVEKAE